MKKLYLAVMLLCCAPAAWAQYYYLAYPEIGKNPGGLNTDAELSVSGGLSSSWTVLHPGSAATPQWTATQVMPFLFKFNGSPAFQYKVSTAGILTFDIASTVTHGYVNGTLPSPSIPDKSICLWGLKGNTSNDKIVTKVFGTAPNRQFWIMYNGYEYEGGAPICNLYWSIVLEETTNNIYIVDQRGSNIGSCQAGLTVGIQIDATKALMVDGSPSLNNLAGTNTSASDNTYYEFVYGTQPAHDMSGVAVNVAEELEMADAPVEISGTFLNLGAAPIRSFDLYYSVNGVVSEPKHYLNPVAPFTLTHDVPWVPAAPGSYEIKMWIANINGQPDSRPSNDEVSKSVFVVNKYSSRTALIESFTQHNCGPCASQNPFLEATISQKPTKTSVIKWVVTWPGANDDPRYFFNTADNGARRTYYNITGVPTTIFAGTTEGQPADVTPSMIEAESAAPGLFDVSITEGMSNDSLNVSVTATPIRTLPSGLKLRVALIQDELHYSNPTGTNGETDFYHIMRYTLPNAAGTTLTGVAGVPVTVSGKRKVQPIFYNSFMKAVVFVQDDATKEILMASKSTGIYFCANGSAIIPTLSVQDASCNNSDGSAKISLSGGTAPFSYSWSNGATADSVSGLAPGIYTLTVSSATGCQFNLPVEVKEKPAPKVVLSPEMPVCNGENSGKIQTYVYGGDGPYTFSWSNSATTGNIENLAPGNYTLSLTDASGCTVIQSVSVAEPALLTGSATKLSSDNGNTNGSAFVSADGGVFPYTYSWNTTPVQSTDTAVNLAAGVYEVTITDYYGCELKKTVTINSTVGVEDLASLGIAGLETFPNPVSDVLNIRLKLEKAAEAQIRLFDMNGKTVYNGHTGASMMYEGSIDLGRAASGVYLLEVETEKGVARRRIAVQ
ncbi:MAG: T9SS C-terminal target domain-containing protein [Bacteroidetes bacterium]|nr:MAG: T9SS C-terminal target domain-containing protein [Bacteroidota bacterium]